MSLFCAETAVSSAVRKILFGRTVGTVLDLTIGPEHADSALHLGFCSSLEYFLPDVLKDVHRNWHDESLDGIGPVVGLKTADFKAIFFGMAILINDQKVVPFELHIQISSTDDRVTWLELKIAEQGPPRRGTGIQAIIRHDYEARYRRFHELERKRDQIDWAYHVWFGTD